ncbi:MAG: class I SAM-dependent methyltransferase [Thermoleophilia bacterium]
MDRDDWDRRYEGTELLWTATPNRFLVQEVEGLVPGRALDLACGEGRNAVWLAEQGWQVTGADFSPVALGKAARLAEARGVAVEWVEADATAWEPPVAAFDLVCVLYLQLPADERRLALANAARAVAPGGTLLVVGHDLANLEQGVGGPSSPAVLITADAVAGELAGLVVERAGTVLRPVEVEGGTRDAIDTLVRARRAA